MNAAAAMMATSHARGLLSICRRKASHVARIVTPALRWDHELRSCLPTPAPRRCGRHLTQGGCNGNDTFGLLFYCVLVSHQDPGDRGLATRVVEGVMVVLMVQAQAAIDVAAPGFFPARDTRLRHEIRLQVER